MINWDFQLFPISAEVKANVGILQCGERKRGEERKEKRGREEEGRGTGGCVAIVPSF